MRVRTLLAAALLALPAVAFAQATPQPYRVLQKAAVGGSGGMDYIGASTEERQLMIPRGDRVDIFDIESLKKLATIPQTNRVHGAVIDPVSHHGFCSSNPVVMWDSKTNQVIKTINVTGGPDGILFDPFTQRVLILSHSAPNATVIDAKDGSVLGTIDLGGPPEQGQSDGNGKLFISLEVSPGKVAVVDAKAMKLLKTYDCGPNAGGLAGLGYDPKTKLIFACGRSPAKCVAMNAEDGQIVATVPIGNGVDSACFNPATQELFVSTGQDAKLTIIKASDPKNITVEQTVTTLQGGKTCNIDLKTGHVFVIANDPSVPVAGAAAPATAPAPANPPAFGGGGRGRGRGPQGTFTIVEVGNDSK